MARQWGGGLKKKKSRVAVTGGLLLQSKRGLRVTWAPSGAAITPPAPDVTPARRSARVRSVGGGAVGVRQLGRCRDQQTETWAPVQKKGISLFRSFRREMRFTGFVTSSDVKAVLRSGKLCLTIRRECERLFLDLCFV